MFSLTKPVEEDNFLFLQRGGYLVFSRHTNKNDAVVFAVSRVPFLAAL